MTTNEETLSDKMKVAKFEDLTREGVFTFDDVKDFIKKLKERFPDNIHIEFSGREINNVILDLAGKELI
jgi:hypothetical protein